MGGRGLSLNLSSSGVRTTVGVPGSGMSYRSPTFKWGSGTTGSGRSAAPTRSTTPRGRKEKLRTILPDPTRYPQIDEECKRLMTEQPSNWEWILAYRLMTLRFTVVRQAWENVTGYKETPRHPHGIRDALSWNRGGPLAKKGNPEGRLGEIDLSQYL